MIQAIRKKFRSNKSTENSYAVSSSENEGLTWQTNITRFKCEGDHKLQDCLEFLYMSLQNRWELVKSIPFSRNCLSKHMYPCKNQARCRYCQNFHHSLLYYNYEKLVTKLKLRIVILRVR